MQIFLEQITQTLGTYLPSVGSAMVILIVGWIVAWIVAGITGDVLKKTELNNKLEKCLSGKEPIGAETEKWTKTIVFWFIMIFVFIAFFETLGLKIVTDPLNRLLTEVFEYVPRLFGAGLLIILAWTLANVIKLLVSRVLTVTKLDEKVSGQMEMKEEKSIPLSKSISEALYWFVFLFFLPAVLGSLGLEGLLGPVQSMVNKILDFIPNLLAASIIFIIGWFIGKVVQRIVTNLLIATGIDRMVDGMGQRDLLGKQKVSGLIGLIAYVFILIPAVLAGLNALKLEAITQPVSNMLNSILGALPLIFAAFLLLALSYVVGRFISEVIASVLAVTGFNRLLVKLGIGKEPGEKERKPSEIVGTIILVAIMLFALMEAAHLLQFDLMAELVSKFTIFAGQVLLGLIILGTGLFLSNIASKAVRDSKISQAGILAMATRGSILILAVAMALRQMGLASEIINLAFGLILGSIAVAVALAFGLGGREIAAREIEGFLKEIKSEK